MACLASIDLGGTHCRLARFDLCHGQLRLVSCSVCLTTEVRDTADLLRRWAVTQDCVLQDVDALVVAAAGPVLDGRTVHLSNAALHLDLRQAGQHFGPRYCLVVNDFRAEACAALTEVGESARHLGGPRRSSPGQCAWGAAQPVAILGPGTGLGSAWLLPVSHTPGGWQAMPAEAGHTLFAFTGPDEMDFAAFAAARLGRSLLYGDDVVSGRGLALLHQYLTGEDLTPAGAAAVGLAADCPTLRWYARFLGRACAHWALSTLCYGGLYLTGGMVRRNPLVTSHAAFFEAFALAPELGVLKHIPVLAYTDGHSALWGAAWLGAELLERNTPGRSAVR